MFEILMGVSLTLNAITLFVLIALIRFTKKYSAARNKSRTYKGKGIAR